MLTMNGKQRYFNRQFNQEVNCCQAGKLDIYKDEREREREREKREKRERDLYFKYFISLIYLNSGNYKYSYLIPQRNLETKKTFLSSLKAFHILTIQVH